MLCGIFPFLFNFLSEYFSHKFLRNYFIFILIINFEVNNIFTITRLFISYSCIAIVPFLIKFHSEFISRTISNA